jgi:hypothetical protein
MRLFGKISEGEFIPKLGIFWNYYNSGNWSKLEFYFACFNYVARLQLVHKKREESWY